VIEEATQLLGESKEDFILIVDLLWNPGDGQGWGETAPFRCKTGPRCCPGEQCRAGQLCGTVGGNGTAGERPEMKGMSSLRVLSTPSATAMVPRRRMELRRISTSSFFSSSMRMAIGWNSSPLHKW
jgi:hypothetical protein